MPHHEGSRDVVATSRPTPRACAEAAIAFLRQPRSLVRREAAHAVVERERWSPLVPRHAHALAELAQRLPARADVPPGGEPRADPIAVCLQTWRDPRAGQLSGAWRSGGRVHALAASQTRGAAGLLAALAAASAATSAAAAAAVAAAAS